jgi:serine/threonine-protein kinase RsbW
MLQKNHKLVISLRDRGKSFNIDTYKKPDVKNRIKLKKRGGVGVYLMTQLMDEVSYDQANGSNTITMAKQLI